MFSFKFILNILGYSRCVVNIWYVTILNSTYFSAIFFYFEKLSFYFLHCTFLYSFWITTDCYIMWFSALTTLRSACLFLKKHNIEMTEACADHSEMITMSIIEFSVAIFDSHSERWHQRVKTSRSPQYFTYFLLCIKPIIHIYWLAK